MVAINKICPVCDLPFVTDKKHNTTSCSVSCAQKLKWLDPHYRSHMVNAHKGKSTFKGKHHRRESIIKMREAHYSGKDKTLSTLGYVLCYSPDHPRAINGRVPEQVLIAERVLGRLLKDDEVVHHVNGIKNDNRNCNLLICSIKYHKELHAKINGFGTKIKPANKRDKTTGRFLSKPSTVFRT